MLESRYATLLAGAALVLALEPLSAGAEPGKKLIGADSVIPAVYAYRCDTDDSSVRDCAGADPIYGSGFRRHVTHTLIHVVNASGHTLGPVNESTLRLYLFGTDGAPAEMDATCAAAAHYADGYVDLLQHDDDGTLDPGQAVALYLNYCMNDNDIDTGPGPGTDADPNPPLYARLEVRTNALKAERKGVSVVLHANVEESVETLDGRYGDKAVALLPKETLTLGRIRIVQP